MKLVKTTLYLIGTHEIQFKKDDFSRATKKNKVATTYYNQKKLDENARWPAD